MKPIKLYGPSYSIVELCLIDGEIPYLGVFHDFEHIPNAHAWHYLQDRDLRRLELAVKKCRKALKEKRKKRT